MKAELLLFVLVSAPQEKAKDTMRSRPATQLYADGWERIFAKQEEAEWDLPMPPKNQLN